MKRILYFFTVLFASVFSLAALDGPALLAKCLAEYDRKTPESYRAEIRGDIVDQQIATVPRDQFTHGRNNAALIFYFKKGYAPKLVLSGASSFYATMFSIFTEQIMHAGFLLPLVYTTEKAFFSRYKIEEVEKDGSVYTVTIRDREAKENEYALVRIDAEHFVITKSEYYSGKTLVLTAVTEYEAHDDYLLPSRLYFYNERGGNERISSEIEFHNHKIVEIEKGFFK